MEICVNAGELEILVKRCKEIKYGDLTDFDKILKAMTVPNKEKE